MKKISIELNKVRLKWMIQCTLLELQKIYRSTRSNKVTSTTHRRALQLWHRFHFMQDMLYKMNMSNYGICKRCDEAIELERLLQAPHVQICTKCHLKATHPISNYEELKNSTPMAYGPAFK